MLYEIRIKGHLNPEWADWFGDATVSLEANGETLLTCTLVDQASLYGLLHKVRDLGIPLISVLRIDQDQEDVPDGEQ
jgi:hypothetical protein